MALKPSAQKVADALAARGFSVDVLELTASTRTAAEAAVAVGCEVAQIAKSLVFRARESGRPVLVVASGVNRVDVAAVATLLGEEIERADAQFVREQTGFAIGGIPPTGHARPLVTFLDEDLLRHPRIWAAAGHPQAMFATTPAQLVEMTGGQVARIA